MPDFTHKLENSEEFFKFNVMYDDEKKQINLI
jgi:hypothetical protein